MEAYFFTLVVDLSFIPEKYRLDVQRAEQILHRCLAQWLLTLEGTFCDGQPAVENSLPY